MNCSNVSGAVQNHGNATRVVRHVILPKGSVADIRIEDLREMHKLSLQSECPNAEVDVKVHVRKSKSGSLVFTREYSSKKGGIDVTA